MRCVSLYLWSCWFLAQAIGQLRPIVQNNNEYEYILRIISKFDSFRHYKNFITFAGDLDDGEGYTIVPSIQYRIMETFGRPLIIAGPETGSLHKLIGTNNLAIVMFSGIHDPVLTVVQNAFQRLNLLQILFVYKPKKDSKPITDLKEAFFNWCWKLNFAHSSLIFKRNNDYELWTYAVRSSMFIFQITEWHINTFKNAKSSFLSGYQALIAVFQCPPYVFVYNSTEQRDLTGSNVSLGGQTGILIGEFMRLANGTMKILQTSREDYCPDSTQCRIGDKIIDIGGNLVSNTSLGLYSPLVVSTKYCLVVPYERLVPLRDYVQHICGNLSMLAFFVFSLTIIVVIKRLANPRMPLSLLIFETFKLYSGRGLDNQVVRRMGLPDKIMMICILLYSLLTTSIYVSSFTTAFTTGLRMPQIVDTDSFVANDIDIMTTADQLEEITDSISSATFTDRMIFVDQSTLDHHLNSLNDSYVYIIETHRWPQFEFIQEHLRQPKLTLASDPLCTVERHLRLPIQSSILIGYILGKFIERSTETGLTEKWMRMGLQQLKRAKMIRQHPYNPPTLRTLPLEFYTYSLKIYAMGISLSLITLLLELVYIRRINRNNVIII